MCAEHADPDILLQKSRKTTTLHQIIPMKTDSKSKDIEAAKSKVILKML